MALHWSIEEVLDYQDLANDAEERAVTEAVVWASMIYGLGRIAKDNLDEWLFRQEFVLITEGWAPICKWPDDVTPKAGPIPPMRLTPAQYERRIGLFTNVTTCSRKSWLKSRLDKLAADAEANLRRMRRE